MSLIEQILKYEPQLITPQQIKPARFPLIILLETSLPAASDLRASTFAANALLRALRDAPTDTPLHKHRKEIDTRIIMYGSQPFAGLQWDTIENTPKDITMPITMTASSDLHGALSYAVKLMSEHVRQLRADGVYVGRSTILHVSAGNPYRAVPSRKPGLAGILTHPGLQVLHFLPDGHSPEARKHLEDISRTDCVHSYGTIPTLAALLDFSTELIDGPLPPLDHVNHYSAAAHANVTVTTLPDEAALAAALSTLATTPQTLHRLEGTLRQARTHTIPAAEHLVITPAQQLHAIMLDGCLLAIVPYDPKKQTANTLFTFDIPLRDHPHYAHIHFGYSLIVQILKPLSIAVDPVFEPLDNLVAPDGTDLSDHTSDLEQAFYGTVRIDADTSDEDIRVAIRNPHIVLDITDFPQHRSDVLRNVNGSLLSNAPALLLRNLRRANSIIARNASMLVLPLLNTLDGSIAADQAHFVHAPHLSVVERSMFLDSVPDPSFPNLGIVENTIWLPRANHASFPALHWHRGRFTIPDTAMLFAPRLSKVDRKAPGHSTEAAVSSPCETP